MVRKTCILLVLIAVPGFLFFSIWKHYHPTRTNAISNKKIVSEPLFNRTQHLKRLKIYADTLRTYAVQKDFNSSIAFLVDMSLPGGRNRFFVYDLKKDAIKVEGLVAHGSCNTRFMAEAKFSNIPDCGCSSLGKYRVSYSYKGQFGKAFKLNGLDKTNDNAFKRFIVLHGYDCVPEKETYPQPICNSLGCPMVSNKFLEQLSKEIATAGKPVVLWMFK